MNARSFPRPTVHPTRLAWVLGLVLIVIAAMLPGQMASAEDVPSDSKQSSGPKPTIVLVHGAWADASSWSPVTRQLQRAGYQVLVPPNPLRSLSSDAEYLSAFLRDRTSGPVVLAGHSYGGAVVTNAAASDPDVEALVYINAFAPDEGEDTLHLATEEPGSHLAGDPTTKFDFVAYPGAPEGDADLYVKQDVFPGAFANDLPRKRAAMLAASQRPITFGAAAGPSGPPAWKTIPSWYLVGTIDNVIPPAQQRAMAERAGSTTVEAKAGHLPMLSKPDPVTKLIDSAARSVR